MRLESVWIEENYLKLNDFKKEENTSFITSVEVFKPNKTLLLHIQIMTPLGYYISSQLFKEILEGDRD